MKLSPLTIAYLQNVEFGQFITRLFSDVDSLKLDLTQDPEPHDQLDELKVQSELYDNALQQIIAREESAQLLQLDLLRDHRITAISKMISVYENSDIKEEQNAYAKAKIIMNKYDDIEAQNFEAESKSIQLMLNEWSKDENKTLRDILNLEKLLAQLRKAAEAFDSKFNTRSAAVGIKEVYNTKAIRKQLKSQYEDLAKDILAMAKRRKNTDFYTKLLDMVNNGRHYFADILARRKGSSDAATPVDPEV